jgi:hypothetical protein
VGGMILPDVQRAPEVAAKTPLAAVPPRIEIELPGGIKVRVDGDAQPPVLGRVMKLVRGLSC